MNSVVSIPSRPVPSISLSRSISSTHSDRLLWTAVDRSGIVWQRLMTTWVDGFPGHVMNVMDMCLFSGATFDVAIDKGEYPSLNLDKNAFIH